MMSFLIQGLSPWDKEFGMDFFIESQMKNNEPVRCKGTLKIFIHFVIIGPKNKFFFEFQDQIPYI